MGPTHVFRFFSKLLQNSPVFEINKPKSQPKFFEIIVCVPDWQKLCKILEFENDYVKLQFLESSYKRIKLHC